MLMRSGQTLPRSAGMRDKGHEHRISGTMLKPSKSEGEANEFCPLFASDGPCSPRLRSCTRGCTKRAQQHHKTPFFALQRPRITNNLRTVGRIRNPMPYPLELRAHSVYCTSPMEAVPGIFPRVMAVLPLPSARWLRARQKRGVCPIRPSLWCADRQRQAGSSRG
jgi:hypothetical protein